MPESLEDLKKRRAQLRTTAMAKETVKHVLSATAKEALEQRWLDDCWAAFLKGKPSPDYPKELTER